MRQQPARQHRCDTDNPSRPCCWAARKAEFATLEAANVARVAAHGSIGCDACGQIYSVVDGAVLAHDCQPRSIEQIYAL